LIQIKTAVGYLPHSESAPADNFLRPISLGQRERGGAMTSTTAMLIGWAILSLIVVGILLRFGGDDKGENRY
jgi:hypothetical protein